MSQLPPDDGVDDFVDVPGEPDVVEPGENEVSQPAPNLAEAGNLSIAHTMMANEFAASAGRRSSRADQLSGDSQAMWSIAMTSPTVMAAQGIRTMTESGSGRTRSETNLPASTSAAGNAG